VANTVIKLQNVTKYYGKDRGILDVSLNVFRGSVFGFLGPNGSGKTTTINLLMDLIRPTMGSISVFGLSPHVDGQKVREQVGYLDGEMALDESLTGWQQLEYFGHLRKNFDAKYVRALSKKLNCELDRKIRTLSRGNRQKVGLISALMHKPRLLILDEPTNGLDPLIQEQFNRIIHDYKKQGKTVFISSHILSEVEELCDRVAFIRRGQLIACQPISKFTLGLPRHVKIVSKDSKLPGLLAKIKGVSHLKSFKTTTIFQYLGDYQELLILLSKYNISDLSITPPDLESLFSKYYEDDHV